MELARRRVASTIQRMDRIFRSVRSRIAQHQEKRKERIIRRGLPFEIGLLVRRKLQPAERRLGKLSPYESPRYEIIKKRGDTYWCRQLETKNPRIIQRHYDDLEVASETVLSWEKNRI